MYIYHVNALHPDPTYPGGKQAGILRAYTDDAIKQLRRYSRDIFDLLKKKVKQTSIQEGRIAPLLLSPDGVVHLFPNEDTVDMFVYSYLEVVSDVF